MDKRRSIFNVAVVATGFFSIVLACFLAKESDFSLSEKRKLATKPVISAESLLNRRFMKDFESYTQDQFPFREGFRKLAALYSCYLAGRTDNHDIFVVDKKAYKLDYKLNDLTIINNTHKFEYVYSAVTAFCKEGSKASKSITSDTAGKYIVSYAPIEGTNWVVVVRALEKNVFSDLLHLGISLFIVGVVVIVGIVVVLVISIGRITTPIYNITKAIVTITDGDFTVDIPVTGNDEVTLMAKSLNTFMDKMRSTFGSFSDTSNRIDMQAEGSESIAEELHELASGQYEAMNNMMENLEELVKSIGAIAEDATTLALVASDTDEAGVNVISNISSTMTDADAGRRSMSEVTVAMSEAKESMGKLRKAVFDVGEAALKIDEITNTIKEIAGKTNLLALNASIEAARAGEAGKGFAVVATEIKELANTSADAANEIAELISSVSGLIQDTVKQSEMSEEQISSSAEMVEKASDQFNEIYGSIASTNDIVNVMIEKIHKTNDVASNMAAITEEQSASAEEIESTAVNVQALAQTVTNNSSQVKSDSGELTVTANELKAKISQFKI